MSSILLAVSDFDLHCMLKIGLTNAGHNVTEAFSADIAICKVKELSYDAVVIDFTTVDTASLLLLVSSAKSHENGVKPQFACILPEQYFPEYHKMYKTGATMCLTSAWPVEKLLAYINSWVSAPEKAKAASSDIRIQIANRLETVGMCRGWAGFKYAVDTIEHAVYNPDLVSDCHVATALYDTIGERYGCKGRSVYASIRVALKRLCSTGTEIEQSFDNIDLDAPEVHLFIGQIATEIRKESGIVVGI